MLIYGKRAVTEVLGDGHARRLLLARGLQPATARPLERLASKKGVPVEWVPRIALDQELKTTHHQGVAAELPEFRYADPERPFELAAGRNERVLLVLLDQITDAHNYGAIIRSAEALGAHGVVSEARRSAPFSPVTVKTSAGASAYLPIVRVTNLPRFVEELKERGVWVYGADSEGGSHLAELDWDRPLAVVIGSEGTGMRRLVRDKCDALVSIPLRGRVASLNASVAAGILIHAAVAGRHGRG